MVFKKLPIAATPLGFWKAFSSLKGLPGGAKAQNKFTQALSSSINRKYLFFFNSGLASFFIILKMLQETSSRKEVILPAYTAPSLVVAVKKAGLIPVLCDISLDDFNVDFVSLSHLVTEKTLCILGVHMFGIVSTGLSDLKKRFPDVFIIEDCAQSMGSKLDGITIGALSDISFFSFNRGK
ncbi:DegT/DnrJ/EryC1/StrS family aminotransferase, partial [Candidatus Omnitrophota bacterium]